MESFVKKIEDMISLGWELKQWNEYEAWCRRVSTFLSILLDAETAAAFMALQPPDVDRGIIWNQGLERQIGYLEGIALRIESKGLEAAKRDHLPESLSQTPLGAALSRVFLVHSHDEAAKETTARFLEKLGLEVIILSEQANEGRTVIEKFEVFSDVGFAVALFTPDDIGAARRAQDQAKDRARQNVVLELGYFTGKLGRPKGCALFKPEVELPSDLHGVMFLELDSPGAWKTKLAQELMQAGMKINLQGLLSS